MVARLLTSGGVERGAEMKVQGLSVPMDRRGFLRSGVAAALALPGLGLATKAHAMAGGDQTVVVLVLTGADPETGVGGWVDTADGGRYDAASGVVAIPGTVGQSLAAMVYRDDGCSRQVTLGFRSEVTFVVVGGC